MRHHILDHPHACILTERHDALRMELHGSHRLLGMLDPHDRAILAFGRDDEITVERRRIGEDRVITADGHFFGKAREDRAGFQHTHARRLAMHGDRQLAQLTAIGLRQRLQAEADAEDR